MGVILVSQLAWGGDPQRLNARSPHGPLKIPCENCHTAQWWMPIRSRPEFDHNQTGFPIHGMHKFVPCEDCHISRVFKNASTRCQDCHFDPHRNKNSVECSLCHRDTGWYVSAHMMNEHTDRFPLIGAHAVADCYSCHKAGTVGKFNRQGLSTLCDSCHLTAFNQTKRPNHRALGLSTDCTECHHSFDSWAGAVVPPGISLARVPRR
jgi:hypothetical protein